VDVGAEADVVGQVETVVVGIFVDDDLVGAPLPVVAEAVVVGENAEVEAAEPEAIAPATFDAEDVAAAEAAVEAAMLPGMIDVVVRVIAAGIVADPFAIGVDVGSVGVAVLVVKSLWLRGGVLLRPGGRGAVSGNVSASDAVTATAALTAMLPGESESGTNKNKSKNTDKLFHASLRRDLVALCRFWSWGFVALGREGFDAPVP